MNSISRTYSVNTYWSSFRSMSTEDLMWCKLKWGPYRYPSKYVYWAAIPTLIETSRFVVEELFPWDIEYFHMCSMCPIDHSAWVEGFGVIDQMAHLPQSISLLKHEPLYLWLIKNGHITKRKKKNDV